MAEGHRQAALRVADALEAVAARDATEAPSQPRERRGRHPWDRQPEEPPRHYERFLVYRRLGPKRSVRKAVETQNLPKKDRNGVRQYWSDIATQWKWVARAHAWDRWRQDLAQKRADALAIASAEREAEELEAERRRQIRAGRNAVHAGSAVIARMVSLIRSGDLDKMTLERVKLIVEGEQKGSRIEKETKAVTEFLSSALIAIVEGQRIQRIAQEQATEKREVKVDLSGIDRLAEIIMQRVPREQWDEVMGEIDAALRGES